MGALLVKRLLWRVSTTLTDTRPQQFTRFPERDMVAALQCGVRALCKYLPHAGARSITMRLQPGARQSIARIPASHVKHLDGSASTDLYPILLQELTHNMGSDGLTPGRAITIADRQRLDMLDPLWRTRSGSTVEQYAYNPQDPLAFWVVPPVPSSPEVWVGVSLVAPPAPIAEGGAPGNERYSYTGASTDTVGLDDQFEDELWNYCVAYLLLSDAKSQNALNRAAVHVAAFNASINSMAQALTGQNPNLKQLPFAPEVTGAAS